MTGASEAAREAGRWLRDTLPAAARLKADSRRIGAGDGFLAFAGARSDGRDHIGQAIARGAAAVLYDADDAGPVPALAVPARACAGLRRAAGDVASVYYREPSADLDVVAFTGTNGKTTCANWCAAGLAAAGAATAAIGTLGVRRYGRAAAEAGGRGAGPLDAAGAPALLTTPDAVSLQDALATLRDHGVVRVALEASSIGLVQERLRGCLVDVAVFTNLSRDHLDFHADMDDYARAKSRLFAFASLRGAVANGDDPAAPVILAGLARGLPCTVFGRSPRAPEGARVLRLDAVSAHGRGIELRLSGDFGVARAALPAPGEFNAMNACAVLAAWLHLGISLEQGCEWLGGLPAVPGRLQPVGDGSGPLVLVDYAHTPDALRVVLEAVRPTADARGGRLWCIVGCGGDRDAGKRPEMARAAAAGADRLVLTSDNPRSEPPRQIIDQMRAGLASAPWAEEPDRGRAIGQVIAEAAPADVVLIAGKGHESTQEIAGERLPFSDHDVALAALADRNGRLH